jgi:hypothetical protein
MEEISSGSCPLGDALQSPIGLDSILIVIFETYKHNPCFVYPANDG